MIYKDLYTQYAIFIDQHNALSRSEQLNRLTSLMRAAHKQKMNDLEDTLKSMLAGLYQKAGLLEAAKDISKFTQNTFIPAKDVSSKQDYLITLLSQGAYDKYELIHLIYNEEENWMLYETALKKLIYHARKKYPVHFLNGKYRI